MTVPVEAKESQNVAWKESWRDGCLKWICGFANAEGGTICTGVNDQGEVLGAKDGKRLLERFGVLEGGHLTRVGAPLFTDRHHLAQTATYTNVGMFGERRSGLLFEGSTSSD